jgi:hypothetical protein
LASYSLIPLQLAQFGLIKNLPTLSESHNLEAKTTEKGTVVLALLDFFSEHI